MCSVILQVLPGTQSFSALSTPDTGMCSSHTSSFQVFQVLAGTQSFSAFKRPRYLQVVKSFLASGTPVTGRYSSHFQLYLLQVLAGIQSHFQL